MSISVVHNSSRGSSPAPDMSNPEEDDDDRESDFSFYTPRRAPSAVVGSAAQYMITSQDSLDSFHDAQPTLHSPRLSLAASPSAAPLVNDTRKCHQRRRHFSSGAKIGCAQYERVDDDWPEVDNDERTCMLSHCDKGPVARLRACSRSCASSPFHCGGHLSLSTNSLKRKSIDRVSSAIAAVTSLSSHKIADVHGEQNSSLSFKPTMLQETDESSTKTTISEPSTSELDTLHPCQDDSLLHCLPNSTNHPVAITLNGGPVVSNWRQNYVPYDDIQTALRSNLQQNMVDQAIYEQQLPFKSKSRFMTRKKRSTCQGMKEEFALSNFQLDHSRPHLFVTSQWQQANQMCCMYLAYRLFWGVYFTMWAIWSWVGFAGYQSPLATKAFYPIFLTNWAIWILAIDTMLQAFNVLTHMKKISEDGHARYLKMKKLFNVSWALSTISSSLHVFVTLIFWFAVYPYRLNAINVTNVNVHIMPCMYVFIDLFVSATPRRLFHAYLPMGVVTVYGVFSDLYYLAGGLNHHGHAALYPVLDWRTPTSTLLLGSAFVLLLIPAIHMSVLCLYALKVKLWRSINDHEIYKDEFIPNKSQAIALEEKV